MKIFLKIFLILISAIFLASCCPGIRAIEKKNKQDIITIKSPVTLNENTGIYRAKINAMDNYFSGLIYFKLTDSLNYRIVFLSELGMTLMNLKLSTDKMEVVYCPPMLNKKMLLKQLEKDFRLLLLKYQGSSNERSVIALKKADKAKIRLDGKCLIFHLNQENDYEEYYQKKLIGPKSKIIIDNNNIVISRKLPKYRIELTKIEK